MTEPIHIRILEKEITKELLTNPSEQDAELYELMEIFKITAVEAALIALLFKHQTKHCANLNMELLLEEYGLSTKEYFQLLMHIDSLTASEIISNQSQYGNKNMIFPEISLNMAVIKSVILGKSEYALTDTNDPLVWLDHFDILFEQIGSFKYSPSALSWRLLEIIKSMPDSMPIKPYLINYSDVERTLLIYCIYHYLYKESGTDINTFIEVNYGRKMRPKELNSTMLNSLQVFKDGLLQKNLVKERFSTQVIRVFPSNKAIKLLLGNAYKKYKYSTVDFKDIYSIFNYFDKIYTDISNSKLPAKSYIEEIRDIAPMMESHAYLSQYTSSLEYTETILLYLCISQNLNYSKPLDVYEALETLTHDTSLICSVIDKIENNSLKFLKDNLIEKSIERSYFRNNISLSMTPIGAKKLLNIKPILATGQNAMVQILMADKNKNELYFDGQLNDSLNLLKTALSTANYKKLTKDLSKNGFSKGFVCLFYGATGTGKTAAAKELARVTKRTILQVDISKIRDMYVGESEKRLKKVFNEYYALKEQMSATPILLFNEADALIGKRIDIKASVDQMNNSMQNILLEELEKFNGIFIATTNITDNLDSAFSRRFLYKINFLKPTSLIRKQIWKKYLPELDEKELSAAACIDLTGGQIENISKRYFVERAIRRNTIIALNEVISSETSFKKENNVLGFNRKSNNN